MRLGFLMAVLVLSGCGNEVSTYRIAPYLEPGYGCTTECGVSLIMPAYNETHGDPTSSSSFHPEELEKQGFTFKWGVEQLVELEVERYHTSLQDDPGVRFIFRRVLETRPVEPGARFTMVFLDAPPGHYPENMLVREGNGFLLAQRERLECGSAELCEQLAARRPGEERFALELSYPEAEGAPLRLHAVRDPP